MKANKSRIRLLDNMLCGRDGPEGMWQIQDFGDEGMRVQVWGVADVLRAEAVGKRFTAEYGVEVCVAN